jgi:hypothetical protein
MAKGILPTSLLTEVSAFTIDQRFIAAFRTFLSHTSVFEIEGGFTSKLQFDFVDLRSIR